jgi:hypothetical protein
VTGSACSTSPAATTTSPTFGSCAPWTGFARCTAGAEEQLRAAKAKLRDARSRQAQEHDKLVGARSDLDHGRDALAGALAELITQSAAFAPYAHSDLRPLLEVTQTAPWPAASQWPTAGQATATLVDRLLGGGNPPEPAAAISAVLPEAVTLILAAFTATRGGRAVTDGVLKGTVDRMWSAHRQFENALKAGEDGYQADLTGDAPLVVDVATKCGAGIRRCLRPQDRGGCREPGHPAGGARAEGP